MKGKEKHQCVERVFGDRGFNWRCSNNGTVEKDGKWFCGIHSPEAVAKRGAKQEARYQLEHEANEKRWERQKVKESLYQAAIEINPSNPMAVAESIVDMFQALWGVMESVTWDEIKDRVQYDLDGDTIKAVKSVLAKLAEDPNREGE